MPARETGEAREKHYSVRFHSREVGKFSRSAIRKWSEKEEKIVREEIGLRKGKPMALPLCKA